MNYRLVPGKYSSHYGVIGDYPVLVYQSIDDKIKITFGFKYKRRLTINDLSYYAKKEFFKDEKMNHEK